MVAKMSILLLLFVCAARSEVVNDKFKTLLLNKHNEYRLMQHGSDMNKLVWSDELAREADAWINRCNFEHEKKGRGENLAYNTGKDEEANINTAMENWYNEIYQYNYAGKACYSSCHYTQVVWAHTREVGCAMKRCPYLSAFGRNVENAWYLGCWYEPKGNDMSEYPYHKGSPCSECLEGQTCENGLCVGKGEEKCEDIDAKCPEYGFDECKNNPNYMNKKCRKTCRLCSGTGKEECMDLDVNCPKYGIGECKRNPNYMNKSCRKTCNQCSE